MIEEQVKYLESLGCKITVAILPKTEKKPFIDYAMLQSCTDFLMDVITKEVSKYPEHLTYILGEKDFVEIKLTIGRD